tara:strand:+ start:239 stop:361 length:123 start_codon:yes stop_codon:yes gene_type:complete
MAKQISQKDLGQSLMDSKGKGTILFPFQKLNHCSNSKAVS